MYLLTSIPFKSRYIHIAMFLLLATIGSVCQQGALVEELCCGYSYVDDGGNSNRIVYKIYNNSGIHGHVVQYVHNSAFILVLQQPKYEEHLIDLAYKVRTEDPGLQQNSRQQY